METIKESSENTEKQQEDGHFMPKQTDVSISTTRTTSSSMEKPISNEPFHVNLAPIKLSGGKFTSQSAIDAEILKEETETTKEGIFLCNKHF